MVIVIQIVSAETLLAVAITVTRDGSPATPSDVTGFLTDNSFNGLRWRGDLPPSSTHSRLFLNNVLAFSLQLPLQGLGHFSGEGHFEYDSMSSFRPRHSLEQLLPA